MRKDMLIMLHHREEQEKKINQIPQFMATIKDDDGTVYKVHFMGLFSIKGDAIPIAFFHGWPGSFLEFQKLFSVLKTKYGDDPAKLPYHLIAPSLIGFGLSDKPPKTKDFDLTDLARIMNKLMIAIGFKSGYVAQGGDIGSMLSQRLAQNHAECKALHRKRNQKLQQNTGYTKDMISKFLASSRPRR